MDNRLKVSGFSRHCRYQATSMAPVCEAPAAAKMAQLVVGFLGLLSMLAVVGEAVAIRSVTLQTATRTLTSSRPAPSDSAAFARWLVANGLWGVVSTISIHLKGVPFGNIVSFSDGPAGNSTGTPYFYLTALDPTARDLEEDDRCSFTISEASLGTCGRTDVENPTCSKITLSGKMIELTKGDEKDFAAAALFSKHPEMPDWPKGHNFHFYKLNISDIFLIDFFGGPKPMTVSEYYATHTNLM